MAKAKKDFTKTEAAQKVKDNPTLDYISSAEPEPTPTTTAPKPPEGYKVDYHYTEVKKRRLQLVLQPSLYERIKAESDRQGISVNEYCHRTLNANTPGAER